MPDLKHPFKAGKDKFMQTDSGIRYVSEQSLLTFLINPWAACFCFLPPCLLISALQENCCPGRTGSAVRSLSPGVNNCPKCLWMENPALILYRLWLKIWYLYKLCITKHVCAHNATRLIITFFPLKCHWDMANTRYTVGQCIFWYLFFCLFSSRCKINFQLLNNKPKQ